jgi:hypothetical protein
MINVILADIRRTRIYTTEALGDPLKSVASLMNPPASTKVTHDVEEAALQKYTADIAHLIERQAERSDCDGIALVAHGPFLQRIKRACSPRAQAKITLEMAKEKTDNLPEVVDSLRDLRWRQRRT